MQIDIFVLETKSIVSTLLISSFNNFQKSSDQLIY